MRPALLFSLLLLCIAAAPAAVPGELESALQAFRTDPPPGWSFTEKSEGAGQSMIERCDATRPAASRWSLIEKNGRQPTATESREYREGRSGRSGTVPRITDQLDLATGKIVADDGRILTFQCPLRKIDAGDSTSSHLVATIQVDRANRAVTRLELANKEPFSPTIGVKIAEMKTVMTYSVPSGDRPGLPQLVTTHVRGRAFWFKSLDEEMTVSFSNYQRAPRQ